MNSIGCVTEKRSPLVSIWLKIMRSWAKKGGSSNVIGPIVPE